MGLATLLLASGLVGVTPGRVLGSPQGYAFTPVAFLDDPAPGGGSFTFDFEPYGINNRGEALFVADLTTGGEGVFVASGGQISEIARTGQPAPGGGTFGVGDIGRAALNDGGDVAFVFALDLPVFPNSGVYRFSHSQQTLSAVMVPGVTPAPGGGTFAGVSFANTSINNRGDIVFSGAVTEGAGLFLVAERS